MELESIIDAIDAENGKLQEVRALLSGAATASTRPRRRLECRDVKQRYED